MSNQVSGKAIRRWAALIGIVLAVIWFSVYYFQKRRVSPRGGLYFFHRVELAVPQWRQADPLWHNDQLGWSNGTLGAEGCAVASAAMVLNFYGIDTDPQR